MVLNDDIVIVTGGCSGIGLAITDRFVQSGARVAVLDVNEGKLAACADRYSHQVMSIRCDVTSQEQVRAAVEQVVSACGRVDVLVNNAGGSFGVSQPVDQISGDEWDRVVDLNLRAVFLCIHEVLPHMRRQHYGRIVNVSSMAGRGRSVLGGAPYAAAKAGVIGLTRHISMDLGRDGVTINAVAPGTVLSGERVETFWNTRKTEAERQAFLAANPLGRLGTVEDIAAAVHFLGSREAAYITGAVLDVNGGSWVG